MKLVGVAAIILALAVGYYFVIYLPQRDKAQEALQAAETATQQSQQTNNPISNLTSPTPLLNNQNWNNYNIFSYPF